MVKIKGQGLASAAADAVIIGPIDIDRGKCSVSLVSKTDASGATTPTSPKLQVSPVDSGDVWVDVPSGSVTPSGTADVVVLTTVLNIMCKRIRVVAAGAFGANDATIYLQGVEE